MWRSKNLDLEKINNYIEDLLIFKSLKDVRWERINDAVQMANQPATPDEDLITPPDENITLSELQKDPDYPRLREKIIAANPMLHDVAKFLHFNAHHQFEWVSFRAPLLGNDVLEDGLKSAYRLREICEKSNYFLINLWNLFKFRKVL